MLTTSAVLQFCIPVDTRRAVEFADNTFEDFFRAAPVIGLLGFMLAAIVSIAFVLSVQVPCCLRIAVWTSVWVVFLVCAGGAYFLLEEGAAQQRRDDSRSLSHIQILLLKALGGILAIVAALWFCLFAYLRDKIALAISLIQKTTKAILAIPVLMIAPLLNVIVIGGFSIIWIIYSIYVVTSGDIITVTTSTGYSYKEARLDRQDNYNLIYLAFMWLWTAMFILDAGQWICAHTVLSYYFTVEWGRVGSWQLFRSTGVFVRYHMGTVAFGSLILTLIQFTRTVLLYIKAKLGDKGNILVKMSLCCCSCCLCCLSKCIKFIDKHAYIQSALNGTAFCTSARRAFGLLLRNLGSVATISVVSNLVIFVGKVSVTVCCAGLSYYYISQYMTERVNGFVIPVMFVGVIAYVCSSVFLDAISMTSDTVLQVRISSLVHIILCLLFC
jgi:solute carrier family 44 protein 1 (choline transporter-like protein)